MLINCLPLLTATLWLLLIQYISTLPLVDKVFPHNLAEQEPTYWNQQAFDSIRLAEKRSPIVKQAKNVILFLGDGMGVSTLTAGRIRKGQIDGKSGEEGQLNFEQFDNLALIKTYNVDKQVPDSAGTATAYLTGVKANYETIGVNARVNSSETNCDHIRANAVDSIMETARRAGKVIGLVTTTRITHATPAASYAHVAHRDWEYDAAMPVQTRADGCRDIAYQLINREPGNSFRVIFGGGRRNFKPISPGANKTADAYRTDGVDLIEQWKANRRAAGLKSEQFAYVQTRDEMAQLDNDKIEFAFGLFDDDHVVYHAQRDQKPDEPTLTQMAVKAVQMLSRHKQGFVLLIEGGRIDHAHHENHAVLAIEDMVELDRAIGQVLKLVDREETLSVVTADHSHTFIINGYPRRGNSIYGNTGYGESKTNKSFTTLMYGNGPGHKNPRPDSRLEDTAAPDYLTHSAINLTDSHHGGEDVALYSQGPMAHLYYGLKEQNYIPHVMQYALCIGRYDRERHCVRRPNTWAKMESGKPMIRSKFPHRSESTADPATESLTETSTLIASTTESSTETRAESTFEAGASSTITEDSSSTTTWTSNEEPSNATNSSTGSIPTQFSTTPIS